MILRNMIKKSHHTFQLRIIGKKIIKDFQITVSVWWKTPGKHLLSKRRRHFEKKNQNNLVVVCIETNRIALERKQVSNFGGYEKTVR